MLFVMNNQPTALVVTVFLVPQLGPKKLFSLLEGRGCWKTLGSAASPFKHIASIATSS